jgi:hypothetical protein
MDQSKNVGQLSGDGPSNRLNDGKGKQISGGCSQKEQQQTCSEEDSEDEALLMGDLVVPGSKHLRFGNFDLVEIRTVSCITINVNPQAVINEYVSNFVKYKQDPPVLLKPRMLFMASVKMSSSNWITSLVNLVLAKSYLLLWKKRKKKEMVKE